MTKKKLALATAVVAAGVWAVGLTQQTAYALKAARPTATLLAPREDLRSTVAFVLQPADCLGDGTYVQYLQDLSRGNSLDIAIFLVGQDQLSEVQASLFAELGFAVSIRSITSSDAAVVGERLGYSSTPFSVVFDGAGRVAGTFPKTLQPPADLIHTLMRQ